MSSNHFLNHGCSGCGGGGGRRVHSSNICGPVFNPCNAGPFVAIDRDCIVPPANTGSIIPFSSGIVPATLVTLATGLVGTVSAVGFGTSVPGITIVGNTITLGGTLPSEAFVVPREGSITALSASFVATAAIALTGTATIRAQIYRAPQGSPVFTATGAFVDLAPPIPGPIAIGSSAAGNGSFAPVPVSVGDRLLMVFSVTSSAAVVIAVVGNAAAGITID
jgi:BclB C-terminal domain-containing protein